MVTVRHDAVSLFAGTIVKMRHSATGAFARTVMTVRSGAARVAAGTAVAAAHCAIHLFRKLTVRARLGTATVAVRAAFLLFLMLVAVHSLAAEARAQETDQAPETRQLEIEAVRVIDGGIQVDGALTEDIWQRPGANSFVQLEPVEDGNPTLPTEVWVAYDNEAIYFAARMHDTSPDSIIKRLGRRDEWTESDCLEVDLDPFHDHRTGYAFITTASGCMIDQTIYNECWKDDAWDGVWQTASKTDKNGWTTEIRVPFSQIRFHNGHDQVWGVNFFRLVARSHEIDSIVRLPKNENRLASLFAHIKGIAGVKPSSRIELLPYTVGRADYLQVDEDDPFNDGSELTGNAGLDFKLGLGSNLTVDGTVNPDFGQVEVDPAVVNLSEFETYFTEKRPFFIEGSEIFGYGIGGASNNWGINWMAPSFFYSRRIGRAPEADERHDGYVDRPDVTTILGAAKLTGKLPNGTSLGLLQAVTQREYAEVDDGVTRYKDEIEPLTSFTVLRTKKEFGDRQSSLGLIATSVLRDMKDPLLETDFTKRAFAAGVDGWTFLGTGKSYVLTGWLGGTRIEGSKESILSLQESYSHYFQRPDAPEVKIDSLATSLAGWGGRVALNKEKGNSQLNIALGALSPEFNTNDAGFHQRSDRIVGHVVSGYSWFKPSWIFREKWAYAATAKSFDFSGRRIKDGYLTFMGANFTNYWHSELEGGWFAEVLDHEYTRGGPLVRHPSNVWTELELSSDERKKFEIGAWGEWAANSAGGNGLAAQGELTFKPSSGVSLSLLPQYEVSHPVAQWVDAFGDPLATGTYGTRYIFATMDQTTVSLGLRINCAFTPKTSFQLYAQPLISTGDYKDFKEFARAGTFDFNKYGTGGSTIDLIDGEYYHVDPDGPGVDAAQTYDFENPDFNYKSLRVNAVFRWEYRPGSTLYVVWTQFKENDIGPGDLDLSRDAESLFDTAPDNIFLVKLTYWLNI